MNDRTRIAAITGAGGALGGALAQRLAADGYRLLLLDIERGKARMDALALSLGGAPRAVALTGDFATDASWRAALELSSTALGGAPTHAALVAGGWDGGAPLHEAANDEAFTKMMHQNVDTAYRALRALLPAMVAAKDGSVVVVGSRAVERPWTSAGASAYAASKAAVTTMMQTVASEVLEHGVRLNAILPSTMDTPANRASMPNVDPTRWVSLESASGVIAFLLSSAARDVSGAMIPVYGRA